MVLQGGWRARRNVRSLTDGDQGPLDAPPSTAQPEIVNGRVRDAPAGGESMFICGFEFVAFTVTFVALAVRLNVPLTVLWRYAVMV